MKYLLLFVLEVLLVFNSYAGNYWTVNSEDNLVSNKINKGPIYMLKSNDDTLKTLNNQFFNIMQNHGYDVKEISVLKSSVNETKSQISQNRLVVNLHASDFYEYNLSDLAYSNISVSNNGIENTLTVCVLNVTSESIQPCNETTIKTEGVMLFSSHIEEQGDLLNALINSNPHERKHIVVCLWDVSEESIQKSFKDFTVEYRQCDEEPILRPDTLAVIAPVPLEMSESICPFIFYEPTDLKHIPEYKDRFPNSTVLLSWQSVVITVMDFLRIRKWRRVGVLSDDSAFSIIFENELISRFDKNRKLLYEVKHCSGRYCDFKEALTEFRDLDIKVIIANIDEANVEKVLKTAMNVNMGHEKHWIFRGHLRQQILNEKTGYFYKIRQSNNKNSEMFNISAIIWNIIKLYEDSHRNYSEFRRRIASIQPEDSKIAEIYRYTANSHIKIVTLIDSKPDRYERIHYSDWPTGCTVKSNTFYKPCSDVYILYIILVCVMSLLFTLIILWYFERLQRGVNNYVNI